MLKTTYGSMSGTTLETTLRTTLEGAIGGGGGGEGRKTPGSWILGTTVLDNFPF